ncbi:MAG: 16S rRNA (uracil(1498)-N(3))-methyltransferase [Candidatus Endonucleobacter bathymodioli]|uniref:Ribosomal RNA small subunit methyltransferase E n=1 Tax=Candidatus Endonucleibacter bathymodioli TaxID=539814 RepID=A0AA90NKF8_9GAMM|nr:16S rRNA (uracil(1498)-N(3))-methyltransferase [Candidatus Endonucleobacter bathymodioli]
MNLLLLTADDFLDGNLVKLNTKRFKHIKMDVGNSLRVGLLNGQIGNGTIISIKRDYLEMTVQLSGEPPPALPLTVLLALPRPKMLKRCLQHLSALGVKRIFLMNSYRVEKSFWQSPCLSEDNIREQLTLGLEQARDTVLPEVMLEKRFKPFIEDRVPAIVGSARALVAHPGSGHSCPRNIKEPSVLAIGPEGGFIPYEVEMLEFNGFEAIHLGLRILRVETAVIALISRLYD